MDYDWDLPDLPTNQMDGKLWMFSAADVRLPNQYGNPTARERFVHCVRAGALVRREMVLGIIGWSSPISRDVLQSRIPEDFRDLSGVDRGIHTGEWAAIQSMYSIYVISA
jgi:hypothetical protein